MTQLSPPRSVALVARGRSPCPVLLHGNSLPSPGGSAEPALRGERIFHLRAAFPQKSLCWGVLCPLPGLELSFGSVGGGVGLCGGALFWD